MKQDEEFTLLLPEQIKKEKLDGEVEAKHVKEEKISVDDQIEASISESKHELQQIQECMSSSIAGEFGKTSISEVFTDESGL